MTTALAAVPNDQPADLTAIERVVVAGDLAKLTAEQRWDYYRGVCQSVGLNPFTTPFSYITLNGKLTLYALKGATDQLRRIYSVSIGKPDVSIEDGLCMVSVIATDRSGRTDAELGIVPIEGLRGDAKANAILKAITKAKRRVTLSMCGLGMLDELETETISSATFATVEQMHGEAEPTVKENERARALAAEQPAQPKAAQFDRAAAEEEYARLAREAVVAEHPKAERIAAVDASSLTDGVLLASIKALDEWLTAANTEF